MFNDEQSWCICSKQKAYLRIGVLGRKTARLLRRCIPSTDDSYVEIVQLQSPTNAHHVGWIHIQMYKCGIGAIVTINTVNIGDTASHVSSNFKTG